MRTAKPATLALAAPLLTLALRSGGDLPGRPSPLEPPTEVEAAIARQRICVGSTVHSAGDLADVLFFRHVVRPDGGVSVGYFVFFSEERPFGNNWLTWAVGPALAIDFVYTRTAFVLPGLRELAFGKGDVEGIRVDYERDAGGALIPRSALADDDLHRPVTLDRAAMFAVDGRTPTFYAVEWSHHLGGRGARSGGLAYERCYEGDAIRPLPDPVAQEFRLEARAWPARALEGQASSRSNAMTLAPTSPAVTSSSMIP